MKLRKNQHINYNDIDYEIAQKEIDKEIENTLKQWRKYNAKSERLKFLHKYGADGVVMLGIIGSGFNGLFCALGVAITRKQIIERYLSKPQNQEILNSLYDKTGLDNVTDVAYYLCGDDGFAKVLYHSSGAFNEALTVLGEYVVLGALAGFVVCYGIPKIVNLSRGYGAKRADKKSQETGIKLQELKKKREELQKKESNIER